MSDKLLTAEDFEDKIGSDFTIDINLDGTPDITLKLMECERNPRPQAPEAKRQGFSIIFHGELSQILPSQIYTLQCDKFDGPLELFLTVIGQTNEATEYEAVFN